MLWPSIVSSLGSGNSPCRVGQKAGAIPKIADGQSHARFISCVARRAVKYPSVVPRNVSCTNPHVRRTEWSSCQSRTPQGAFDAGDTCVSFGREGHCKGVAEAHRQRCCCFLKEIAKNSIINSTTLTQAKGAAG